MKDNLVHEIRQLEERIIRFVQKLDKLSQFPENPAAIDPNLLNIGTIFMQQGIATLTASFNHAPRIALPEDDVAQESEPSK